ncbi:unnamed protein product [Rhizophagus irregularis]|nr:unnamed protein product [Rhizophagus irregularis]
MDRVEQLWNKRNHSSASVSREAVLTLGRLAVWPVWPAKLAKKILGRGQMPTLREASDATSATIVTTNHIQYTASTTVSTTVISRSR